MAHRHFGWMVMAAFLQTGFLAGLMRPAESPSFGRYEDQPKPERQFARSYDICVVGSDLSGAVVAQHYASVFGKAVAIVEKRNRVGEAIESSYSSEHILHTSNYRVWSHLQSFSEWIPFSHREVIDLGNETLIPFPVNRQAVNTLFNINLTSANETRSWLEGELFGLNHTSTNAKEMILSRVGHRIYERVYEPLLRKRWGKDPTDLSPEAAPAELFRHSSEDNMYLDDLYHAFPKGGYRRMIETVLHHPLIEIHVSTRYSDVRGRLQCGKVYVTDPIDQFYEGLRKLEYRTIKLRTNLKLQSSSSSFIVHKLSDLDDHSRIVDYGKLQGGVISSLIQEETLKDSSGDDSQLYLVPSERNKQLLAKYHALHREKKSSVTYLGRLNTFRPMSVDEIVENTLAILDRDAPRVVVRQLVPFFLGGPEALVQLAVAFHTWMPSHTYVEHCCYKGFSQERVINGTAYFCKLYPSFCGIPTLTKDSLRSGDILIMPEYRLRCPQDLIERGVKIYVWQLGLQPKDVVSNSIEQGCRGRISHNHWLAGQLGGLNRSHLLQPYIRTSKLHYGPIDNGKRENLVLLNFHERLDVPNVRRIYRKCEAIGCEVVLVDGFDVDELLNLYMRAKIIAAFCVGGSERAPIEAVLRGVVMISSRCRTVEDSRDFPIPPSNLATDENPVEDIMDRVFSSFEVEQRRYEAFRGTYQDLGPHTLIEDTKRFIHAIA